MKLLKVLFSIIIYPFIDEAFYVYNTEDFFQIEFYDCIDYKGLFYCRRPMEPIRLQRDKDIEACYHYGQVYSFSSLQSNNISISTILHQWNSSIEKVEEYAVYLKYPNQSNGFLCKCIDLQTFGKYCEYQLPIGTNLEDTINWELDMKLEYQWETQKYGDILCYKTLECNYGLLCLDWREICDGVQQCMFGIDENNCDFLEFNECENDEYRCLNGMCIPQEYFLDGQFDCLDWSDEIQYYDDINCALEEVATQCDDRICPPNQWSCGDGQCIFQRLDFFVLSNDFINCINRRDGYHMCELYPNEPLWTLPNGRCIGEDQYEDVTVKKYTVNEECYIF